MSTLHERQPDRPVRVLYSFPHKIGAGRICYTAWQQVVGVSAAGADVTLFTGAVRRELPKKVDVHRTLAIGRFSAPYRVIGQHRALAVHDALVAKRLRTFRHKIDVVHTWPLGAMQTLTAARELGISTVLERPNAHTRYAFEAVERESRRLGVELPPDHEHAYNPAVLEHEEREYRLADYILCPSDFVVQTFVDQGFPKERLLRHVYGYDDGVYHPNGAAPAGERGLTMLFVGVAAVRKGLHYALDAWLTSPASREGRFLIAGEFLPAYERRLSAALAHPSVEVLGHRDDVPELMRHADVLVLPSIEEGFGLVCAEAMGSGSVPLVSDACTDTCRHLENALVHHVGDVAALTQHITAVHQDRALLARLRAGALRTAPTLTWSRAGATLVAAYRTAAGGGTSSRESLATASS